MTGVIIFEESLCIKGFPRNDGRDGLISAIDSSNCSIVIENLRHSYAANIPTLGICHAP